MAQKYRIYINDTLLLIAETVPNSIKTYQQIDTKPFDFKNFYQKVKSATKYQVFFLQSDTPEKTFKKIKKCLKLIKAAGGIVKSEENKFLFIYRKGYWDLPKGKLEDGEKTKKAAVREVEEECGIKVSKAEKKICKTYHIYEMNNKVILKKTSWYWMKAAGKQKLKPQTEEGITDAKWLGVSELSKVKNKTYPLILDLIGFIEN